MFNILTEDFLSSISFKSSLDVNLANFSMSKFTKDDFIKVICDLKYMQRNFECLLLSNLKKNGIAYRFKSVDSVELKVHKYIENTRKAILCFNDLIGIRVICNNYPDLKSIPNYFQVVDLSNGKKCDDGYRAVHLYYKLSNRHYPIEVQIWKASDEKFINWSHKYCYKVSDSCIIKKMRKLYDDGIIVNEDDFKRELEILIACKWFRNKIGDGFK